MIHPEFVHEAQRLASEISEFGVTSFGFEFGDDHDGNHHIVFVETHERAGVGQKDRGVEDVGPPGDLLHTVS
jgi:hypothetical protein